MIELTKNEELVLLSILKLKDNAYGVTIRDAFFKVTGKVLNYGSLYNTLYGLVRRGLIKSTESLPLSQKGGRRRILYRLTINGTKALSEWQIIQHKAWEDIPDLSEQREK